MPCLTMTGVVAFLIEVNAGRASSNDIDEVLIEEHDLSSDLLSQLSTLYHSQ